MVVCCKHLMNSSREFQWSLSIHKVRYDILSPQTKVLVESWWFSETQVSPNQKEVVRIILGPHVYNEKLMHYLMKTQAQFHSILFVNYILVLVTIMLQDRQIFVELIV
jgi:hypothetical protein